MDGLRQQTPAETIESGRSDDGLLTTWPQSVAVDRNYGGPKEGGGSTTPTKSPAFANVSPDKRSKRLKAGLEALYAEEQPRYPLDSVLNNGPDYRACVEFLAGQSEMLAKSSYQLTQSIAL